MGEAANEEEAALILKPGLKDQITFVLGRERFPVREKVRIPQWRQEQFLREWRDDTDAGARGENILLKAAVARAARENQMRLVRAA